MVFFPLDQRGKTPLRYLPKCEDQNIEPGHKYMSESTAEKKKKLSTKRERITFRVTPEQHQQLTKKAGYYSVSDWMKSTLLDLPPSRTKRVYPHPDFINQLSRIGTNLNQIAKKTNTTGVDHIELLLKLNEIHEDIDSVKRHFGIAVDSIEGEDRVS